MIKIFICISCCFKKFLSRNIALCKTKHSLSFSLSWCSIYFNFSILSDFSLLGQCQSSYFSRASWCRFQAIELFRQHRFTPITFRYFYQIYNQIWFTHIFIKPHVRLWEMDPQKILKMTRYIQHCMSELYLRWLWWHEW